MEDGDAYCIVVWKIDKKSVLGSRKRYRALEFTD